MPDAPDESATASLRRSESNGVTMDERLGALARTPVLLVACDFDGTIAAITRRPADALPEPDAVAALRALAAMPHTGVAVISGRGLEDLRSRLGAVDGVRLIGSHGAEFEPEFGAKLTPELVALRDLVRTATREAAAVNDRLFVEEKPAGAALHYRGVPDSAAAVAIAALRQRTAGLSGVQGAGRQAGPRVERRRGEQGRGP
jgi:trehalose-phosphatase